MAHNSTSRRSSCPCIPVRAGIQAGRTVCYQEINGSWYPIDPNYPPVPPPAPLPTPGVQWLGCKSCTGVQVAPGQLTGAQCEVCFL